MIIWSGLGLKETYLFVSSTMEMYASFVDSQTSEKKSCVFVALILIYFLLLFKFCSSLKFDLTLNLNPKFMLLLVVSVISLNSTLSSLLIVTLSRPKHIICRRSVTFTTCKLNWARSLSPNLVVSCLRHPKSNKKDGSRRPVLLVSIGQFSVQPDTYPWSLVQYNFF
jgi:hypothetical protein